MRIVFLILLFTLTSCSFIQRKGSWGKKAIYPLSLSNLKDAFVKNASSEHFWAPLIGAGVISAADWDQKISNWASTETPIYGSQDNAEDYSNYFDQALKYEAYGTIFLTPSWEEDGEWTDYAVNKAKGTLVVWTSYTQARAFNNYIRSFTFRERPNHANNESFPSGHATTLSAGRNISNKNLSTVRMNEDLRKTVYILNTTAAAGGMWARVEGQRHYPTDVLVGYSLGHLVSGFLYDFLMNLEPEETFTFYPTNKGAVALYQFRF